MYFTKYPHPSNFSFADGLDKDGNLRGLARTVRLQHSSYEGDIHHLRLAGDWRANAALAPLTPPAPAASELVAVDELAGVAIKGGDGRLIAHGPPGKTFGFCGDAALFQFALPHDTRFHGMGEKGFGRLELSGIRTRFWNTDVWGDFPMEQWVEHPCDPTYFSTPYVICRICADYVGFLLDNPHPTWISTPGRDDSRVFVEWQQTEARLVLGSEGGEPNLWVIYGPSLPELTAKLQKLVGVTPLPPLWSLGYHQSRWGYAGEDDLTSLDEQFEKHEIPCNAIWLDIDYMQGYRVFETDPLMFPSGVKTTAKKLAANGRRIIPILDPGVKKDPGYLVYEEGLKRNAFCLNREKKPFVGLVWPGETVFPDFTREGARTWWAGHASTFLAEGFGGAWLDMNDPSTGPVDPTGMLFGNGTEKHETHHNQYALGMQMATRKGFLKARPRERPFLLSRSGFTGTSRFSAIWTGDNVSNRFYLRSSIATSLNLSLSGLPFNGPDIGGFGGDATDELMTDWIKAGFLFPFCRNHSVKGSRAQEPWAFNSGTLRVLRQYIRLRYKLLPYLYNLFIEQEESGEPILRPLFYHFEEEGLDAVDDEFMVGPCILQAPHVSQDAIRSFVLPGSEPWLEAASAKWLIPGVHHRARTPISSPLFFRNGCIVPMRPGTARTNFTDLREVEIHVFVAQDAPGTASYAYRADDGLSFGYRDGERSTLRIDVEWNERDTKLSWNQTESGFGRIAPKFVVHGSAEHLVANGVSVSTKPMKVQLSGSPITAFRPVF